MLATLGERIEPANDGDTIAPGINVIATPGHTPGHAGVVLSSGTERAFVLGDAISCPAQLEETEWSGLGDMDPKLARRDAGARRAGDRDERRAAGDGALPRADVRPRAARRGASLLAADVAGNG